MVSCETLKIVVDSKLKDGIDEWNYFNKKDKINRSQVCRDALQKELDKKRGGN